MTVEQIIALIANAVRDLGFPIAMCAALFWYILQERKLRTEEAEKTADAINNNTLALQKLITMLEGKSNVGD